MRSFKRRLISSSTEPALRNRQIVRAGGNVNSFLRPPPVFGNRERLGRVPRPELPCQVNRRIAEYCLWRDYKGKDNRLAQFEHILELVPDNETVYDPAGVQGRCEGKKTILVTTARRLLICRLGMMGLKREIEDYSWAKFDHVKITEGWGSSSLQLKFRRKNRILKIEGVGRENGRLLYKRIRERISKFDQRFQIASKICPECGETINLIARSCPHCRHEFETNPD